MKLSISTQYAFLSLGYIAQNKDENIILSQTIAQKYGMPLEYLLKIMQQLVRANILRSKRGPRGGFSLGKPLNKITMLDIIEAVEGPMNISLCLDEFAPKEKYANKATKAYDKVTEMTKAAYKKIKVSDLVK